jgi:hypothetical protein
MGPLEKKGSTSFPSYGFWMFLVVCLLREWDSSIGITFHMDSSARTALSNAGFTTFRNQLETSKFIEVNYWETPTWVANRSLTPWHKKINSHLELGIPSPDHHPVAPSYQATHVEFLPLEQCWAGTERENAGFGLIIFLCPSLSLLFVCEYFLNLIAPTVFTVYLIWENQ